MCAHGCDSARRAMAITVSLEHFIGMRNPSPYEDFQPLPTEELSGAPICTCQGKNQGMITAAKQDRKSLADALFWSTPAPVSKRPAKRAKECIA